MLFLQNMDEMELHRLKTDYFIPYDKTKPNKGFLYTVLATSYSQFASFFAFKDFIKSKHPDTLNFYFHEKRSDFQLGSKVIKQRHDVDDLFNTVIKGAANNSIKLATFQPSKVRDKNVVYDTSYFQNLFFQDEKIAKLYGEQKLDKYKPLFQEYFKEKAKAFPKHKKILFVPIHEFVQNTKSLSVYKGRELKNPFEMLYTMIEKYPEFVKDVLNGYTIVFANMNEIFILKADNISSETAFNIKTMMYKMVAKKNAPAEVEENDAIDQSIATAAIAKQKAIDDIEEKHGSEVATKLVEEGKIKVEASPVTGQVGEESAIVNEEDVKDAIIEVKETKVPTNNLTDKEVEMREKISKKKKSIDDIYEISETAEVVPLEEKDIPINTINEAYTKNTAVNFMNEYVKKTLDKDVEAVLRSFENAEEPLKLVSYTKDNTSNHLNKKWTYTAIYQDKNGKKHTVKFDLPKFQDGRFMHLNGSDKIFVNQPIPFPITKTLPYRVQVSAFYNKILINRFGRDINKATTAFKKMLYDIPASKITIHIGSNSKINAKYNTTIEYDNISKDVNVLEVKAKKKTVVYFNQDLIREVIKERNLEYDFNNKGQIPVAIIEGKDIIVLDSSNDIIIGTNLSLLEYLEDLMTEVYPEFKDKLKRKRGAKRYMYSRSKVMNRDVPLVLILAYVEGITTVLEKGEVNYDFYEVKPKSEEVDKRSVIQFADGFLVYDSYPLRNSILLNGFSVMATEEVNFHDLYKYSSEFNTLFSSMFDSHNKLMEAFKNFYNCFIDPITKEVLEHYNMPTDFVNVMLYANTLLEDNSRQHDSNMNSSRIRNAEMVPHLLYKSLATAYESYRATADNPNPVKMSMRRETVLTAIQSSRATENFSELSPVYEIERHMSTTYKGPGGQNDDRSYSDERRSFNDTMMGVFGQSSPVNASIGISRILSTDAKITSTRGYVDVTDPKDFKNLNSAQFSSPAEALVPLSNVKDAPARVSMTSTQSRHTVSTVKSDPQLMGTGMEKALAHLISNKFAFKADQDGVVESIEDNIMIIRYKDGTAVDIDLGSRIRKNASGGSYIVNKLTEDVKVGQKVRAGQIVAYNQDFFSKDMDGDVVLNVGPLLRIAVVHSPHNFEDSCGISHRVSKDMATWVVDKKDVAIPSHSIIHHIAKVGDKVKAGTPLLIFDEADTEESAEILSKLTKDQATIDELMESSRDIVKSKYDGVIEDIKVFSTVAEENLSDSIRKTIKDINAYATKRNKKLKEAGIEDANTEVTFSEKVEAKNGKVKGTYVGNGIMIEFYIRYLDDFSVADKLTYFSALKATVHTVFPIGQEPYLVSDPNEKIDSYIGFITVEARQTKSFLAMMAVNRILYDFKRKNLKNKFEELFGKL